MSSAMIPVRIRHTLKRFYLSVNMFNDYPFPRKPFVVRFLLFVQLVQFAFLLRYPAVFMKFFYPQIAKISLYQNRVPNTFSNGVLVHMKIMRAAFCLPHIQNLFAFPFYDYLCLYRMTLFFPNNTLFALFWSTVWGFLSHQQLCIEWHSTFP
jgi:hypothetical protein